MERFTAFVLSYTVDLACEDLQRIAAHFLHRIGIDLDKYSDEQLFDFHHNTRTPLSPPPCATSPLSPNLVTKLMPSKALTDAIATQSLAHDLGIRVPEIRRTITKKNRSYIIMDRVHGVTLETCWSRLGWIVTIRLAVVLRKFVRQTREVTSLTAGGLVTGASKSLWFEDYYGLPLHATPSEIQSYITFWLECP